MIAASTARCISEKHEVDIINNAIKEQRQKISEMIREACHLGLYSITYCEEDIYPVIITELSDEGYKITKLFDSKDVLGGSYKIFKGVNISW